MGATSVSPGSSERAPQGDLRVQMLGTGNPFGTGGRLQTCILVDCPGSRFLIDCGATSMLAMARAGIDPDSVDTILLTHLHGDHFGGIPFMIVEALAGIRDGSPAARRTPLQIAGPSATEARVRQATEAFGYAESYARAMAAGLLRFITLEPRQPASLGPLTVTAYAVPHTPEATALRVDCRGKAIAYSGDSGWTDELLEAASYVDLFLCQAWTYRSEVPGLLSYRTVREQRPRLTCKRLVLTHIGPEMQRHLSEATVEVAEDGMVITL